MLPPITDDARAAGGPEPAVIGMRCLALPSAGGLACHSHPFYELTFVTQEDGAALAAPDGRGIAPDTLMLHHPGESHAGWAGARQQPRCWVLHFAMPPDMLARFPRFAAEAERVWTLAPKQAESFRRMFLQMLNERMHPRELQAEAETAWLQLLLVSAHRWVNESGISGAAAPVAKAELMNLWHLVNASVGQPPEYLERIHHYPNYDSLRHGFKRTFGRSPRAMVMELRIQHAKNLLLDSSLSVKEIAGRCGYQRQHEFARAFRQQAGVSPTEWRLGQTAAVVEPAEFAAAEPAARWTA